MVRQNQQNIHMIKYNKKPLEDLNLEETFEFEKQLLRKSVTVHLGTQDQSLKEQFQNVLDRIKLHKFELMERERFGLDKKDYKDHESKIIGEDEQEQSDDS